MSAREQVAKAIATIHQGNCFFGGCEGATSKATFGPWLHSSSGFSTETTCVPCIMPTNEMQELTVS